MNYVRGSREWMWLCDHENLQNPWFWRFSWLQRLAVYYYRNFELNCKRWLLVSQSKRGVFDPTSRPYSGHPHKPLQDLLIPHRKFGGRTGKYTAERRAWVDTARKMRQDPRKIFGQCSKFDHRHPVGAPMRCTARAGSSKFWIVMSADFATKG